MQINISKEQLARVALSFVVQKTRRMRIIEAKKDGESGVYKKGE